MALLVKNLPANAQDTKYAHLIPGLGRYHGERNGNPLQYSCLENSMGRGAWWTTVHEATKSQAGLSVHMGTCTHTRTHTHMYIHTHSLTGSLSAYLQNTPQENHLFRNVHIIKISFKKAYVSGVHRVYS